MLQIQPIGPIKVDSPKMRVFFSAGEASGDRYAAELARRLKSPDLTIQGIGGKRLQEFTDHTIVSSSNWGAIGIVESLKVVPRVLKGLTQAKKILRTGDPGLFIPIDFGFLNIQLAKFAKAQGWKVLYFIPPGSWRKTKQGSDLPQVTDAIVTPFPWSADILNKMGADAHFFGHPLLQMVNDSGPNNLQREGIAILPGSRDHEITYNLPVIAQALKLIPPPTEVKVALASNVDPEKLKKIWKALSDIPLTLDSDTYRVLKSSKAALVCSGTATLESALCNCPTVVVYRASKITELEFRLRKPKFDYISLPNILLNQPLLPELIQWDATPERVAKELNHLLTPEGNSAQLVGFEKLIQTLQPENALDQTVELAKTML